MAYRDVLFAPLTSVVLLGGLERRTVAALPMALEAVTETRRAARRRWPGPALRARSVPPHDLPEAVAASVHHEPDGLTDAELIVAAHEHGLSELPVALTLTSTRCAVVTAHAVFDGTSSLDLVHDLLDSAAGLPLPAEPPIAPHPVLQALRTTRPRDVRAFVRARRARPAAMATQAAAADSVGFALAPADLAAVRRYREPHRVGRATLHSRLASLLVAALVDATTSDRDIPIWMTTDLRHLVQGRVEGNFIGRERIGTLHGDQWAPGALAARLVQLKGPGQALSLVWSPTGWLLRSALGRRPAAGEEIVLTQATTRRAFPVPVETVVATSIGGSPTFGFVWQTQDAVYVSVYNSSGAFDLSRFEDAFRGAVRRRATG